MIDKTYNGWTNYETWRVNLEIFDRFDFSYFNGADDAIDPELVCVHTLAEALQEHAEEIIFQQVPINQPSTLMEDYARAFLEDVNWYEIAKHMVNDYIAENQE